MERLRNAATSQPRPSPTLAISMLFHSCPLVHSGCWVLLHLRPRRLYDMSATLSAISRMRGLNQYAQTLSSPFLLLFVLVSEALQAAACQKSENRLVRG